MIGKLAAALGLKLSGLKTLAILALALMAAGSGLYSAHRISMDRALSAAKTDCAGGIELAALKTQLATLKARHALTLEANRHLAAEITDMDAQRAKDEKELEAYETRTVDRIGPDLFGRLHNH